MFLKFSTRWPRVLSLKMLRESGGFAFDSFRFLPRLDPCRDNTRAKEK